MNAIKIKRVAENVSLGQSTIYRWINEGKFPKPFDIGGNQKRWLEEDIDTWLAEKAGKPWPPENS